MRKQDGKGEIPVPEHGRREESCLYGRRSEFVVRELPGRENGSLGGRWQRGYNLPTRFDLEDSVRTTNRTTGVMPSVPGRSMDGLEWWMETG